MRTLVQSYKVSKSAKTLATFLGLKRIKIRNSRFVGRRGDLIVNWGVVNELRDVTYLNPIAAVRTASNKLRTLEVLKANEVSVPSFFTSSSQLVPGKTYLARETLTGSSGEGILPLDYQEGRDIPSAPLYTEFIPKEAEYRVIVIDGKVVDQKKKLKKSEFEGERSPYVWNVKNGYVFARNNIEFKPEIGEIAVRSLEALGLAYGAVDLIEDSSGVLYILEVNTAFGIEGTTTELVGNAIKTLIDKRRITCAG